MSTRNKLISFLFAILIIVAFFYRIDYFNFPYYDEQYYVDAGKAIQKGELDNNKEHPPLAKWLISIPMHFVSTEQSLSWRISPLVFGVGGLFFLYFFARRIGLSFEQSLLAVAMLVATKSWYILSRVAMLDIFVSFFILVAAYFLYWFMVGNRFPYSAKEYKHWWSYWVFCVVIGVAGAAKWSGFFPLIFFVIPFWWFYVQESKMFRIKVIVASGLLSFVVYSAIAIALLQGNVYEFLERNGVSFLTHNSTMLPENNPPDHLAYGGFNAFWRYFVFDQGYAMKIDGYAPAEFSNNHVLAISILLVVILFLMVFVGKIIRVLQKIDFEVPAWFLDQKIIFLMLYSFTSVMPWALIPRDQYIYYYVPAFPTLILMIILLLGYFEKKVQYFYYVVYFGLFLYGLRLVVPI